MTRPRSVTAAAGVAALSAALVVVLWTVMDFAISTTTEPRPPAPPAGVSQSEWEAALASPSPAPEPEGLTNLELYGLLFDGLSIALPLAAIVLWLAVGVAALRGLAWCRPVAVVVAAAQGVWLPVHATGSAPVVLVVTWAAVAAGAACVVLLSIREATAWLSARTNRSPAAVPAR
jgi:hypothetical protein